jgi:glucose/arabinose dehydrogenase
MTQSGEVVKNNPLSSAVLQGQQKGSAGDINNNTTNLLSSKNTINSSRYYYAYGIRNSFGMAFDPITKNLWDTENGPDYGDEINLVEPGFNSGWQVVQGMAYKAIAHNRTSFDIALSMDESSKIPTTQSNESLSKSLVTFGNKGKYSDPKFEWQNPVSPTALAFLGSDGLGKQYQDDMFVGDFNYGRIYHFKLNLSRNGLLLAGPIENGIAETNIELKDVIFATGFNGITDIKVSPDGYLYVLSYNDGSIYRIIPKAIFADAR